MTFVIAHRGSAGTHRENTVAAFEEAGALGATWVELDVRAAGDGTPVVHHDPLPGPPLPPWVPPLETVVDRCAELGLGVVVELKEAGVAAAVDRLLRGRDQRLLVSSFLPHALAEVHSADRALLFVPAIGVESALQAAAALGCRALHPRYDVVDAALVAACRDAHLGVMPWTVNERSELERLRDLGVTAIITDDIPLALSVLV